MANIKINLTQIKETFSDEKKMHAYIQSEQEKIFSLPGFLSSSFQTTTIKDMQVLVCGEGEDYIVYIPGGGFVSDPSSYQLKFALDMAKVTKKRVYTLIYPKIPKHDAILIQKKVGFVLQDLAKDGLIPSIVSDSAGSAIVLATLDQIKVNVSKLVFLSPNVDLRYHTKEQDKLQEEDDMLGYPGVKILANFYKGNRPLDDAYISPILLDELPSAEALIIVGKKEMMLHDARLLKKKYEDVSIDHTYYEVTDMMHDFVFYPIEKGREYKKLVFDFIQK